MSCCSKDCPCPNEDLLQPNGRYPGGVAEFFDIILPKTAEEPCCRCTVQTDADCAAATELGEDATAEDSYLPHFLIKEKVEEELGITLDAEQELCGCACYEHKILEKYPEQECPADTPDIDTETNCDCVCLLFLEAEDPENVCDEKETANFTKAERTGTWDKENCVCDYAQAALANLIP